MGNKDHTPPVVPMLIPHAELQNSLDQLKHSLDLMKEYEELHAEITYAKYCALVATGFTEAQALELCKK